MDKSIGEQIKLAEEVDLNRQKKILFLCFECKTYTCGSSTDSYEHVCASGSKQKNDNGLTNCMHITINALFYNDPEDLTTSSMNLPQSPSLRSSMMQLSPIRGNSYYEQSLHDFLTSTPKGSTSGERYSYNITINNRY